MPLPLPSMTGNVSWKRISEQTQVFRLWEQTPTEATENFICSQDQNIRPKVESHTRKISEVPWNLGFVITGFRKRRVRTLSSVWKASEKCIPQSDAEVKWKHMEISLRCVWKQERILSSQLESVGSLRSTDPLLLHCHRIEFLHFINSGPFSNGFASKITQQLTSVWEHPAVHSPVHPGVLASWRQAV